MYPYLKIFRLEIETYYIAIAIGLVLAIFTFVKLCDKSKIEYKVTNFYLYISMPSIAFGFCSAILFQALYNVIAGTTPVFKGMTFLGGLIGGTICFFTLFLIFAKEKHKAVLYKVCCHALIAIAIAHAFGRIGCFLAGCCHGKQTDSFLGVQFPGMSYKVYPTQLFESAFLFALFFALLKFKKYALYIYPIAYGVFRFLLEYIRGDISRGDYFIIPHLSPSQTQSLILIIIGVTLIVVHNIRRAKRMKSENSDNISQ